MSLEMFTTDDLEKAIASSCDKNEQKRLQALLLYKNGLNPGKIAKDFSVNRSTVHRWIKRAEEEGLSSLKCKPGRGSKVFFNSRTTIRIKESTLKAEYQQTMALFVVGRQKMQFNLSKRDLKYLILNQE